MIEAHGQKLPMAVWDSIVKKAEAVVSKSRSLNSFSPQKELPFSYLLI